MNRNYFEIAEKICYLGDILGAGGGCIWQCYSNDQEWMVKFRGLVPLLASGGLPLGAKDKLYAQHYAI